MAGKSFAEDMKSPATRKQYQPRMTDPVSGRKLVKGQPVDPAAAMPPPPPVQVRNPIVGPDSPYAYMQKGKPVPGPSGTTPTGDFLNAAGQTVADTFFNTKKGAAAKKKGNGNGR